MNTIDLKEKYISPETEVIFLTESFSILQNDSIKPGDEHSWGRPNPEP